MSIRNIYSENRPGFAVMEYSLLEDAFSFREPPGQESSRSLAPYSKDSSKDRKKTKRHRTPPVSFLLDDYSKSRDPDRPAILNSTVASPEESSSYFGKSVEDFTDSSLSGPAYFSEVNSDSKEYMLQPDFMDAFNQKGNLNAAGATAAPNTNNSWKSITPTGSRSAFFELLPPTRDDRQSMNYLQQQQHQQQQTNPSSVDLNTIHSKLDKIFSRLDTLDSAKGENAQSEILLFIMSGIFVLFLTDIAVRKGSSMRLS